ncbi:MAG: hypothetical protein ACRC68_15930 [Clostridium sp.]
MMKTVEKKVVSEGNKFNKKIHIEIAKIEVQKVVLEKNKEEFKVLAQSSGTVNLNSSLTSGMMVQEFTIRNIFTIGWKSFKI